jgi:hypothetical protein
MDSMRPAALTAMLLLLTAAPAQVFTTPPPICFAFNDAAPPATPSGVAVSASGLLVWFTAPTTDVIDRIDIYRYPFAPYNFSIDVIQTAAIGAPPTGPSVGLFSINGAPFGTNGWSQAATIVPAAVAAGSTYAIRFTSAPAPALPTPCFQLFHDPAGPHQLAYQITGTAACPATIPATGSIGPMLRFRGASCAPGPPASVASFGSSCGSTWAAALTCSTPPVLGAPCPVSVSGAMNEVAFLFWSVGVNAAGSQFLPGSSCLCYLDLASVAVQFQAGFEPIASGPLIGSFGSGIVTWTFTVPSSPANAGLVVALQAVVIGPSGTIQSGGVIGHVSNGLLFALGY